VQQKDCRSVHKWIELQGVGKATDTCLATKNTDTRKAAKQFSNVIEATAFFKIYAVQEI
jgi:hypothetical protein